MQEVVEKIREKRIFIGKTCKSTLVSLIRYSSAAAKNGISYVLQTAIAGGEALLYHEGSTEKDGHEMGSEEGDCKRYELQEECQFSRLDNSENTEQKMKSVRGRRKTLTGTTILPAQLADKVDHVVLRVRGKKIEPEYIEAFPHKPEQSSIIQKKSNTKIGQKKSLRSDSKFN